LTKWLRITDCYDDTSKDAHTVPASEEGSHDLSRECYCRPELLCRTCLERLCFHALVFEGRVVVHNEAS
jgi:hypothetical protein